MTRTGGDDGTLEALLSDIRVCRACRGDFGHEPRPVIHVGAAAELTLLVGVCAQRWALKDAARRSMTETVAARRTYDASVIPLPHPSWRSTAWLRRHPWFEGELLPHLHDRVAAVLGAS